ncbi:heterokaryon incompatibility protein [Colletotrichum kahawae]|uniref:Heterokaryon incompatibility protein n=1 Tax=Colletotrichum kahawae TaxID=34407 RepID=A0AAD9YFA9_COLKA|nr:heterokaryon incompatibility protein [Colletotrichum kahawae]
MYHYDNLPSSQFIRLVNINRDDASQNGFSVRLTTHSLNDLPPFWALSYTWESPDFETHVNSEDKVPKIQCNGDDMEIGRSLYDFLRHMNQQMSATSNPSRLWPHPTSSTATPIFLSPKRGFNFWIDAICIDQQNDNEKSDQVQLMGEIYKSAKRVVAWLGNTEPNDNVNWVINDFAPMILRVWDDSLGDKFTKLCRDAGHELNHPGLERFLDARELSRWQRSYLDFFAFFVKKRWLTRGWVVQEAAIPKPHAVILLCGKSQFSWTTINDFATLIFEMDWEETLVSWLNNSIPEWTKRKRTIDRLWNPVALSLARFQDETLDEKTVEWQNMRWGAVTDEEVRHTEVLHNFHRLRGYEFKEPLDHIYGTLGVMPLILGSKYPLGVTPSYDITVERAFTDVATWLIPHLPNLDILGLAGLAKGRSSALPSWVPDFSFRGPACYTSLQRVRQLRMRYSSWRVPLDARPMMRLFESPKPFARVEGSRLRLEGCGIDTIKQLHKLQHDELGVLRNISWVLDFCNRDSAYVIGTDSLAEAVVHTLSANMRPKVTLNENYKERSESWVRDCITYNWLLSQDGEKPTLPTGAKGGSSGRPFITVNNALRRGSHGGFRSGLIDDHITKIINYVSPGRQVIITEGGLLGLGPAEAQVGDDIWLMRGGRMPLILRNSAATGGFNEEYLLVGEAYIHGIMHGEMMNDGLRHGVHEVVIV